MSFLVTSLKGALIIAIAAYIIMIIPGLPPHGLKFTEYELPVTIPFERGLKLNHKLDDAEILFENQLHGPEGLLYYEGALYTTLHGGHVVRIVGDNITPFVKFGKSCDGFIEEHICGRPLGLTIKNGNMFVADAYYGLFKVNITSREVTQLVSPETVIEGKKPKIFNSVAVAENGHIYWTDSSTNVDLSNGAYDLFADGSGRLIHYNPFAKMNEVLIDNLHFANGVALSRNESSIVVAETLKCRLLRYFLDGSKKGTYEVFIDGLPGSPDNLKLDGRGNLYVPLVFSRDEENTPSLVKKLGSYPKIRKFITRLISLTKVTFNFVDSIYPSQFFKTVVHSAAHFEFWKKITPAIKRVSVLVVSEDGKIIESFHALDGRITGICDVEKVGEYLYLGSPFNKYLARKKLW